MSSWIAVKDDDSGDTYYQKGDETSWEPWTEDPSVWDIFEDDEGTPYYYNTLTEESTYDRPEILPEPAPAPTPAPTLPPPTLPPPTLLPPPQLPQSQKIGIPVAKVVSIPSSIPAAKLGAGGGGGGLARIPPSSPPKGPVTPDASLTANLRSITSQLGVTASPDILKRGILELRTLLFSINPATLEQACSVANSSVLGIVCANLPKFRNVLIDCSEVLDLLILTLQNIALASTNTSSACDDLDEMLSSNSIAFARNLIACCLKWKEDADVCHKTMMCCQLIAGPCSLGSPKAGSRRKALIAGSFVNAAVSVLTRWKTRGEAAADAISTFFYSTDRNEVSAFITALEQQKPTSFSTLLVGAAKTNPESKVFLNCLRSFGIASILIQRMNEARFIFDQALQIAAADSTTYLSYALTISREDRRYPETITMCRTFSDKIHDHDLDRIEMDLTEFGKYTCAGCEFPIQMNRFSCEPCGYHRCANCHHFLTTG